MTAGAVFNHPLAGPVGDALAVGATHPVFFLPEVALAAHLVAVVHIDFRALFGYQKITLILFMTGIAGQGPCLAAVIQNDFTVGDFSSPRHLDRFIIVALAAFKTLHLVLAGFNPEASPLVSFGHQNGRYRKRQGRIDLIFIKRSSRIFVGLDDTPFGRVGIVCWDHDE